MINFSNLKIFHKGLILVALPLVSELVFVGILVTLQLRAEAESRMLSRSKAVLTTANDIPKEFVEGVSSLIVFRLSHSDMALARFEQMQDKVNGDLKRLNELYTQDLPGLERVKKLQVSIERGIRALTEMKDAIAGGADQFKAWRHEHPSSEMSALIKQVSSSVSDLVSAEQMQGKTSGKDVSKSRRLVLQWLVLGVGANIALAMGLLVFLSAEISNRLAVLSENSKRLSQSKELKERLSGSDEIAEVDDVFHKMAEALNEASRKERAIIDNALDVICALDADLKIVRINPAVTAVWGYEAAALAGSSVLDFVAEAERSKSEETMRAAMIAGKELSLENLVVRADRQEKEMDWTGHWSQLDNTLFCVVRDISERKEMERRRQEFVAMLTHDLRTPLTAVNSFLEGIVEGLYDNRFELLLDRADQSRGQVLRLVKLIGSMLDIEKAEAGMLELRKEITGLRSIVEKAVEAIFHFASSKELSFALPENDVRLPVDADLLRRVVENLLSNAVKFSPAHGIIIITITKTETHAILGVKDQGQGIPQSELELVFEKYKQSSTGDRKGGTGLGLAFCKQVVVAHGGDIRVESQIAQGCNFLLSLPLLENGTQK